MEKAFRRRKQRQGQTLVEYALILLFISIVAISVLLSLGKTVGAVFSKVNSNLSSGMASH